jgi:hypothetical protein
MFTGRPAILGRAGMRDAAVMMQLLFAFHCERQITVVKATLAANFFVRIGANAFTKRFNPL